MIPKKDEFLTYESRIGSKCFAYLAEVMANGGKMMEAIQYSKYSMEILDRWCHKNNFRAASIQKTIFLLKILESKGVSCTDDDIRKLVSVLANSHMVNEYVTALDTFLNDLKWFKDIESVSRTHWKIVGGGTISIITTGLLIFQEEIKALVLKYIVPMLVSYEFLFLVLPTLVLLPLFLYLEKLIPEYRLKLSDLETLVEYLDKK